MNVSPEELQDTVAGGWNSIGKRLTGGSGIYGGNRPTLFTQIVTVVFYPLIIMVALASLYMIFNPGSSASTVVSKLAKGVV